MISALQIILLVTIVALLASVASYVAYQKHEQQAEQRKVNDLHRHLTPREQQALDATSVWGDKVKDQKLK